MTRSPSEHAGSAQKLAEGSQQRQLPLMRPHPDAERPTRELDADKIAELVRSMEDDNRRTRKFDREELRALGVVEPTPTKPTIPKQPLVVIERYRKPSTRPPSRRRPGTRTHASKR